MNNFLFYLGAFALALGLLIVVHEAGHFFVARWCGVKILRFSVGFGKPILTRRIGKDRTELTLAAFPLGGYVKMLDEREGEVPVDELPRAFNRQSVWKRFAIVSAGPIANFLLAICMYWALFVHGVEEPRPLLGKPAAQSLAEQAGFLEGELVRSINGKAIVSWQEFRWEMLQLAFGKGDVKLEVINSKQEIAFRQLDLSSINVSDLEGDILQQVGFSFYRPQFPPVIGHVTPGGIADRAGLREGDRILNIDGKSITSWSQIVAAIREAPGRSIRIEADRAGRTISLAVTPAEADDRGRRIGRIGIGVREEGLDRAALVTLVRYGPIASMG